MSKRKDIVRRGDRVKIVNPQLFIRCGYPLSKNMARERAREIIKQIDDKTMHLMGFSDILESELIQGFKCSFALSHKLVDLIAENILLKEKFGGKERRVFTLEMPELQGRVFRVNGKKIVNTGIREPSCGGYDYWCGGYEYEPPYLSDVKTHKILEIDCNSCEHESFSNGVWVATDPKNLSIAYVLSKYIEEGKAKEFARGDLTYYEAHQFFRIEESNCIKLTEEEQPSLSQSFCHSYVQ